MELYELVSKIESEEEDEVYTPKARYPKRLEPVAHKTEIGEIIYNIYGKNAPGLIYAESNKFATEMLSKGFQWWLIESKLKDALHWCKKKNASHASLRTLLLKIQNR